jgi:hypothetical protein
MKPEKVQDQLYIALVDKKVKVGKTHDCYYRFGGSQYNSGSSNNYPSYVYFAVPSVVFPIDRLELLYEREFAEYLLPSTKNLKTLTEYIDPKHKKITVDSVRDSLESFIKEENLPVMRLKSEYLMTSILDKDFAQKVRDDSEKYLEDIT